MRHFYFGVWTAGHAGHHLHETGFGAALVSESKFLGLDIDTGFCPIAYGRSAQRQGATKRWHIGGFTVISWWDRTGDHRHGSHATFAFEGTYELEAVLALCKEHYPSIMARQPVEPYLYEYVRL